MDVNLTKQAITVNKKIYDSVLEQPLDIDLTLPEYCPEIHRILKCRVVPQLASKNVSGGSLNLDGIANISLIYVSVSGKIFSFEHTYDFQKNIPIDNLTDEMFVSVDLMLDYVNCRAVTSRKIDIHGVISMKIKIHSSEKCDVLADIDHDDIQIKRNCCPATNTFATSEKTILIEEELELSRGNSSIHSILRCDARAISEECSLVGNKVLINGSIIVNILYCTENGSTEIYENRIPFNQILELNINGIECKCSSFANLMSYNVKPRTNLSGETKSFSFECKLSVLAQASCEDDVPVILDAFSLNKKLDLEYDNIKFKKLCSSFNERYLCKKTLQFSENSFGNVLDMWCELKTGQTKISENNFITNGTVIICILSIDTEGQPQYYERPIDFEFCKNLEAQFDNSFGEATIEISSSIYTIIDNAQLEASVELSVCGNIFSETNHKIISGVALDNDVCEIKKKAPIIIYYCEEGESVWDIAKKYKASVNCILKNNELSDDIIPSKRMIII